MDNMRFDIFEWLAPTMHFSSPKAPMLSPMPTAPNDDVAAEAERENIRRQAVVDLAQGGRRSTMAAGKSLTDQGFLQEMAPAKRRASAASSDLGLGM